MEDAPASAVPADPSISRRLSAVRIIPASPAEVFAVLRDPQGHVAIDSSGMLQSAEGDTVTGVDDRFLVHMDRESLGDYDLGHYDVTVVITAFEPDTQIEWTIEGNMDPEIGHRYGYLLRDIGDATEVESYYDWNSAHPDWRDSGVLPVLDQKALRATLGILERAVRRGYVR